ncbi:hypothetical protein [Paraburkholderia sediminicola]|uniref:hypothetical protein n=1 Tax=Paraburkholderia sediminicola TaxID=458836 RepID=UPI0038B761A1
MTNRPQNASGRLLQRLVRTPYWVLLSLFLLAACPTVPQNEGEPARVADVIKQIKADLGAYQAYDSVASAAKPLDDACKGIVGFYIDNVKVSLTTQTDDTVTGTGSATLPVGAATLSPSVSGSHERKGTQTLTFSLYPKVEPAPSTLQSMPGPIDSDKYPIASSLQRLRDGLLEASQAKPCVSLSPASGTDSGGTFVFGFTVINQLSVGGTLKFVIFSLGATNTTQRQASNTITVTFKARPGSQAAVQ